MIQFRTLGVVDLRNARGELRSILSQPKRLALLAWLALERPRGFQSRDSARALFWPEQDDAHARRALNRAIYWLRKSLGEGVLVSRGDEELGVAPDRCWTDVAAFESAATEGRHAEAVELYRGDLLRGFFVADAPGFERWLEAERQRLRDLAHRAGAALTDMEVANGDYAAAARWARWTLERAPCDEPSARRLISILDSAGDRAGAAQAYEQFSRHLAAELDLEPSPETQALVRAIRARTSPAVADPPMAATPAIEQNARLVSRRASALDAPAGNDDSIAEAPVRGATAGSARRPRTRLRIALASAGALALLAAGAAVVRSRPPHASDSPRVVLQPFENRTGDAAFDHVGPLTSDWIANGLAEAGIVETAATERGTAGARGNRNEGRGSVVIRGAYYLTGGLLRFEATVTAASPRSVTWPLRSASAPADSPELAIREIRDRATGASAALLDPRFASWLPLGTATAPTLDAFKEFARAEELTSAGGAREALAHYRRASEIDTTFSLARLQIAFAYLNVLDWAGADSIVASLERRHERLTPLAVSCLDWMRAVMQENSGEAYRAMTRAAHLAPGRFLGLRAETLRWLNRPRAIVKLLRHVDPNSEHIADSYHQLRQHHRELEVATRIRRRRPADVRALWLEIRALAALGRTSQLTARLRDVESLPRGTRMSLGLVMLQAAEELRAHGHVHPATSVLDRAIEWYQRLPSEEAGTPNSRFELARALYLGGRLDAAETLFRQLTIDDPFNLPEYEGSLGAIAARRGDRATAEAIAARLEQQRLAADPPPKYPLFAQARIAAQLGERDRAVRLLRQALGGQGLDLHMVPDFEPLATDRGFRDFIRPKG